MLALIGAYPETSEWLLVIAAIVFIVAAVLKFTQQPAADRGALVPIGLALVAVAWLVL